VSNKLRDFFRAEGYTEAYTQNRLSILSACENPSSIAPYVFGGEVFPLPQTNQMHLEDILLRDPNKYKGLYCLTTSYRDEQEPVEDRHDISFPMWEFELHGGISALQDVETRLLEFLGFKRDRFKYQSYDDLAQYYKVKELTDEHEMAMIKDFSEVTFISYFPDYTDPFFNMKVNEENPRISNKIDVILHGIETVGSAERSCDPEEMRENFYKSVDGKFAKKLFHDFTRERVEKELEEFLSFDFFPRSGGGIGLTRLIRAMELEGLFPDGL
jgi:aspartyl/asparaginyl-tRNA synthetase